MSSLRKRLLSLVAVAVVAISMSVSLGTSTASAMSPKQTTVTGTVDKLYWDLDAFWKWALNNSNYRRPTIGYYYASPTYVAWCGSNLYNYTIMAYCSGVNEDQIWVGVNTNQSKINRLGDYSAGFFLAHEWGHHIAKTLRYNFPTISGRELYADCMAGIFTRYGYATNRLDASDYWEGMASLGDTYPNEGSPGGYPYKADRKAWYQYGFTSYSLTSCAQAYFR